MTQKYSFRHPSIFIICHVGCPCTMYLDATPLIQRVTSLHEPVHSNESSYVASMLFCLHVGANQGEVRSPLPPRPIVQVSTGSGSIINMLDSHADTTVSITHEMFHEGGKYQICTMLSVILDLIQGCGRTGFSGKKEKECGPCSSILRRRNAPYNVHDTCSCQEPRYGR